MRVNGDPSLLSLPSGLAEDGSMAHPLRGGEETTMYDFLHTLLGFGYYVPALDREKEIPPNTFLRLSSCGSCSGDPLVCLF